MQQIRVKKFKKNTASLIMLWAIGCCGFFSHHPIYGSIYDNIFGNPINNPGYTDNYINNNLNTSLCTHYGSSSKPKTISLKQAVNITVACNRNIHKNILNRLSENYGLDVQEYKFMPNLKLSARGTYTETENNITDDINRAADIIPKFNITTPIGTHISIDWENKVLSPNQLQTFTNATHIVLTQPLLKNFGIDYQTASVKNARDSNILGALRLSDLVENEINNTIFLYYRVFQNTKQLEIQKKSLSISKKLLDKTKTLIKAGRLAEYERSQVESQVASQEVNLADAKINLNKSYFDLINQLGINNLDIKIQNKNLDDKIKNNIDKPIDPDNKKTKKLLPIALKNNINYQSLIINQQIAKRDYHVAYNDSRWDLNLSASYQLRGAADKFNKSVQNSFGFFDQEKRVTLEFDIPLDFNPNRNQALLSNKIRVKQLELDKKQAELKIYSELQNIIYQQNILWDKLQLAKKSLNIKQNNFEMARKKYEAGRLSSFELMRMQDDVESARVLENNNIIAYLNSSTMVDKILNKTLPKWGVELKTT